MRFDITLEDVSRAIASGRYQQGYGLLEYNGAFCCLGIAAHVAECERCELRDGTVLYLGEDRILPLQLAKVLNITQDGKLIPDWMDHFNWSEYPIPSNIDYCTTLAELNDVCHAGFSLIAEVMRRGLLLPLHEIVLM